jgi:class 3 adenylate cyclase/tetratricopeptide (TPR) repeat protein
MYHLTPAFILHQYEAGRRHGRFQAAALFLDISGFTAVTEALMQEGKEGAEALADVMQIIFTPLIEAIYARGGFITGFAGDAFTAVFPGQSVEAKARAVAAAWALRALLADKPTHTIAYGAFRFAGKVGLAGGAVEWGILGDDQAHTYYFRGEAIDGSAAAEHRASGGDVILAAGIAAALGPYLETAPLSETTHRRLVDVTGDLPLESPSPVRPGAEETAVAFHPPSLLHSRIRGEFRQVVTVFLNLRGKPSPAALAEFMGQCQTLVHRYDGYLCRLDFGDKGGNLLLFWGAPTGHENDIERALNFLLDLQARSALPLRAGVTYGQVFAGFAGSPRRAEYTCYGLSVNQAARQMTAAMWDQIWMDGETAQRASAQFDVALVGEFPFKGFTHPQPVFELRRRRETAVSLYHGVFVGREAELEQLAAHFTPLANGRFGGVAVISGDAGIGKSRLAHEALAALPAEWRVIVCQPDEILRRPFNPFRHWLRRYFRQSGAQAESANKTAFVARLAELGADIKDEALAAELGRVRSFLGALVDLYWPNSLYAQLEPALRRENTLLALQTLLRAEAERQPVVLVVEDGQWLDEESRVFLRRLPRNLAQTPLILLLASRDEAVASLFDRETAVSLIKLGDLSSTAIPRMVESHLGRSPAPALRELLQERAEGNPFFLEQILLYLQEQGALEETAVGWTVTAATETLPGDVQAVLVARLDRLTQAVRDVVQTAAVLGREFEVQVLTHMLPDEDDLPQRIAQAEKAAVWSALTALIYQFHHVLLRDTAYQMQLRARLRRLHHSAARALERLYADKTEAYALEIGYHFEQAGEIDAAIPYWRRAATAAQENYQNEQALALIEQALAHDDRLSPVAAIALRRQQATLLVFTGRFEAAEATLQRALALAEKESKASGAPDDAIIGRVLNSLGHLYHARGDFEKAKSFLLRSLTLLKKQENEEALAVTYRELGNTLEGLGDYEQATAYYRQGMEVCQRVGDVKGQARAHLNLGAMLWNAGEYDAAERRYRQALAGFEEVDDVFSQGKVYNNMGSLAWAREKMTAARAHFQQSYAIMRECGNYVGQSITLGNLGSVNYYLENYRQAALYHERALEISREANDLYSIAFCKRNLADTYLLLGQDEEAKTMLRESLEMALQIKAEAVVLEDFIIVAKVIHQAKPRRAYLLLFFVRTHPACHKNMARRVQKEEAASITLPDEDKAQIERKAARWRLPDLGRNVLAEDL